MTTLLIAPRCRPSLSDMPCLPPAALAITTQPRTTDLPTPALAVPTQVDIPRRRFASHTGSCPTPQPQSVSAQPLTCPAPTSLPLSRPSNPADHPPQASSASALHHPARLPMPLQICPRVSPHLPASDGPTRRDPALLRPDPPRQPMPTPALPSSLPTSQSYPPPLIPVALPTTRFTPCRPRSTRLGPSDFPARARSCPPASALCRHASPRLRAQPGPSRATSPPGACQRFAAPPRPFRQACSCPAQTSPALPVPTSQPWPALSTSRRPLPIRRTFPDHPRACPVNPFLTSRANPRPTRPTPPD